MNTPKWQLKNTNKIQDIKNTRNADQLISKKGKSTTADSQIHQEVSRQSHETMQMRHALC